jgi:4-hydroxybenzoate polyprenyltransferase
VTREEIDGRRAFALTLAALLSGLAIVFIVPLLALVPVAAALVTGAGLHARCARDSRAGTVAAWTVVGLLGALTFAGAASIGVLLAPTWLLLVGAAVLTPRPAL